MSETKLISPLLDGLIMGDPINEHHGIRCCPAIKEDTNEKYIVKIISVPASPAQMDALLLTGAYPDEASALAYYKDVAEEIIAELDTLKRLAEQEGYIPYDAWQLEPMDNSGGFEIYLLRAYNRTLDRHFKRHAFTHLDALNLGLDLCAAMSVSRRSGYLYVGLKPSNIFVTEQGQYKIGGLGFIRLDSLKYMSLPEKSRSIYTPPEINDAFASLNTTIDVYAIGLVLYQAYNNGDLPFNDEVVPGHKLPPPLYADYEMSEIILKACAPDPAERWQEPVQMGQAIVEYMQRNGALDSPIVPVPTPETTDTDEEDSADTEEIPAEAEKNAPPESNTAEDINEEDSANAYAEDELGNLTFLTDVTMEDLELTGEKTEYEELTGEVTEMLNQADELSTLSVPEPVSVPDYIELPELPSEPEPEEAEAVIATEVEDECEEDAESSAEENEDVDELEEPAEDESFEDEPFEERKKSHWLRNSIIILFIAALLTAGYFYYQKHYVIYIDSVSFNGAEDYLTVEVKTAVDESLLTVLCVDSYGNKIPAKVVNGKAEFSGLLPSTTYNIKVVADAPRKVSGVGNINYSTPVQTNIVRFEAITGAIDGSIILNFTVDGPDSTEWSVFYATEGEAERSIIVNTHHAVINGLTIGKEYTFRLVPKDTLYLSGQTKTKYTAHKVVKAENLEIVSCMDNQLVVKWSAPEGIKVASWQVSCTNGVYNQTYTVTETTATFKDLDHTSNFNVEVIAENMSEGAKVDIAANTATATDLKADNSNANTLKFTWSTNRKFTEGDCKLHYTIAGIEQKQIVTCSKKDSHDKHEATIPSVIPNATYRIWLTDAKDSPLLNATLEAKTGNLPDYSQKFSDMELKRTDLKFQMCKTSSLLEWDGKNPEDLAFVNTFSMGESGTFVIDILNNKIETEVPEEEDEAESDDGSEEAIQLPEDAINVMYVIRNADSTNIFPSKAETSLAKMWDGTIFKLQMPPMPTTAGTYTIEVYFNNGLAATQQFKIS